MESYMAWTIYGEARGCQWMKKQLYIATVVNIVLWECGSLTLWAADLKKLEVFHHKAIRRIMCITKRDQQNTWLTNKRLSKKMNYITTMEEVINERRLEGLAGQRCKVNGQNTPQKVPHSVDYEPKEQRWAKTYPMWLQCDSNQPNADLQWSGCKAIQRMPLKVMDPIGQGRAPVEITQIDQMELKRNEGLKSLQERQVPNQNPPLPPSPNQNPRSLTPPPPFQRNKHPRINSPPQNALKIPFCKPTPPWTSCHQRRPDYWLSILHMALPEGSCNSKPQN
jgi:hypothetical protein